jgi:hypothetical protein
MRRARSLIIPASIVLASGCVNEPIVRPTATPQIATDVAQCSSIDSAKEDKRLSITLTCSMKIEDETPAKIFYFFQHLDKYYLNISKGHRKFKLLNADSLRQGVFIENEETAGGQYVKHRYRVVEFVKDRHIRLVSDPSMVTLWRGLLTVPVTTTVEFEIDTNMISSKLTLKFRSRVAHSVADRMGTREIWGTHVKEEMENAAKIIRSDKFVHDYESK